MSTFNQLITNGYMCYWKSMTKVIKKNAVLWTTPTHKSTGMHFKFNFPFENCSISNSLIRVDRNKNLIKNNNQTDGGFESLQY